MFVSATYVNAQKKIPRYKLYEKLNLLLAFKKSEKKIIINFVMKLSSNKECDVIYNSILIIIDWYIKMIKYILIIKKIDIAKLMKIFFEKIVLRFDMSDEIVNNKKFVFTNVF